MDASIQAYIREAASRGRRIERVGPFLATFTDDTDNPYLSYAIPDDDAAPTRSEIAALVTAYRSRERRPRLEYLPSRAPAVEAALVEGGFVVDGRFPLMACSPDALVEPPVPAGVTLSVPVSEDDLFDVVAVQHEAYGDAPPTKADARRLAGGVHAGVVAVLARDDATGMAAGAATCSVPGGGITEVAGVAVREHFGRRGIAGAVAAMLTRVAFERGVTVAFLTPEHDYTERLYARIGYQSIGTVLHISVRDP